MTETIELAHTINISYIENPRAMNVPPFNEVHMMSCAINSNRVLQISFCTEEAKHFSSYCVWICFAYKEDDRGRLKMVFFINASEDKYNPLLRGFKVAKVTLIEDNCRT